MAVGLVVAGMGIVAALLMETVLSDAWSRSRIDLLETFARGEPNPNWPWLDTEDRTAKVCAPPVSCVQAVGNSWLTLMKFDSVDKARQYADSIGSNAIAIDPLVVHFDGTALPASTRQEIISSLSRVNARSDR